MCVCMCMYACVYIHVYEPRCCVYCIRDSHYDMPTDSAVGTHLNINLSTMIHMEATN